MTPRHFPALCAAALLACAVAAAPLPSRSRQRAAAAPQTASKRTARLGGVSLTYDTALAPNVIASTAAATPLESATDKPDWFWPARTSFDFSAAYPPAPQAGTPVFFVSAVEDFRRAASVSPEVEAAVSRELRALGRFLRRQSPAPAGEVPTVPFPDGHDAFRAHLKYLRFKGGRGVAYLTQSEQDAGLINNEQLTYEFRGLTDDGRHYVYASFPLDAPSLPATRDVEGHDGYQLPRTFDGPDRAARLRQYQAYVARVRRRLARLRPDAFAPSLRLLDETFASLAINK